MSGGEIYRRQERIALSARRPIGRPRMRSDTSRPAVRKNGYYVQWVSLDVFPLRTERGVDSPLERDDGSRRRTDPEQEADRVGGGIRRPDPAGLGSLVRRLGGGVR